MPDPDTLPPAELLERALESWPDMGAWQPPTAAALQAQLPGYKVQQFIARGGMGAVYRGLQITLARPVAIKILPLELHLGDAQYAARFQQEARAMARLNHPGIVSVYDYGQMQDGTLYFIMEFIDGTDVGQMVLKQGRLSSAHAMAITVHVCDALHYAHERDIVHRDIKPANIMVGHDGRVKVADFGLAKSVSQKDAALTRSGYVMGTPHFMAPEAHSLGAGVDRRADIYAVGVMLYQMLTGKLPQGLFEMPSMLVTGLDPRYDQIIAGAMRENRDQRYQQILDMRHALDAIVTQPVLQSQDPSQAVPASPWLGGSRQHEAAAPAASPPAWRKTAAAGWLAAVLMLMVALAAIFGLRLESQPDASAQLTLPKEDSAVPADALEFQGRHYRVYREVITWDAAVERCASLGGRLTTVPDAATWEFLRPLTAGGALWLGGTDKDSEGRWKWLDGTPFTFTAWRHDQPDNWGGTEHYLCAEERGWIDVLTIGRTGVTGQVAGFICEWAAPD